MHNSSGASGQRASSPMGAKKLRDAHADVFTDVDLEELDSHTGPGQEVADPDESGSAYSPSSRKHPGLASPVVFSRDNSSAGRASPSSTTSMVRYDPGQRPAASTSRPPAYQMSADQRRARIQNFHSVMNAAREGNADALQALPLADIDLDAPDADGLTALHHAAANGHIRVVALLVGHGASIQAATHSGFTPLLLAASRGRRAVVECLIHFQHSGVRPDQERQSSDRPSARRAIAAPGEYAFAAGQGLDIFDAMAAVYRFQELEVDIRDLVRAAENGNLEGVVRLLAALANARAVDSFVFSAGAREQAGTMNGLLANACGKGQVQIALALICAGASVDSVDSLGRTPLMHAARSKQPAMVTALLKTGAAMDMKDKFGHSVLSLAIDANAPAVLKALMNGKADIWNAAAWNEPLIHYAASNRKTEIVRMLLEAGADLPVANGSRELARSARENCKSAVSTLLAAGADPHHRAADGHTAFTLAAANGHDEVLAMFMGMQPSVEWKSILQRQCDTQGRTALMLAALNGKELTVKYLLRNHADPHQRDIGGRTALLWAAAHASPIMMDLLRNGGAKDTCTDDRGDTIFIIAAEHNNQSVMAAICDHPYPDKKFGIDTPNKDGDTPLIKAARGGFLEIVRTLNYEGANLLHVNNDGRTALHEAAASGHTPVVDYLRKEVAALPEVFPFANGTFSLLRSIPFVSNLLPARVKVQAREFDVDGNSLMMVAAANGQEILLRKLFEVQPDADARNADRLGLAAAVGGDALALASSSRADVPASPSKINIEQKNLNGLTALCQAALNGQYAALRFLIDQGARVDGTFPTSVGSEETHVTPLWLAARLVRCPAGNGTGGPMLQVIHTPETVVRLLLDSGAGSDINTPCGQQRQTPLIAAASAGRHDVVTLLIERGALADMPDLHGATPLMHAAWHGHRAVVEELLNNGAAPNVPPGALSALILAAESGHADVIQLLADRGAHLDHADSQGTTALIGAAKRGKVDAIKRLIALGANLCQVDARGHAAFHYAGRNNHDEIVGLLAKGAPLPRDN